MNIALTSPFAGKHHCFERYVEGIKNLDWDLSEIDYYVCDNSDDPEFTEKLIQFGNEAGFKSFTHIEYDFTKPKTVELNSEYASICENVHRMYDYFFGIVCERHDGLIFNVEDDVEVPTDSLKKLVSCIEQHPDIVSCSGNCNSRRMKDAEFCRPMAWKFREVRVFPNSDTCHEYTLGVVSYREEPPFGVEIVGATHWGCLLVKTEALKDIGVASGAHMDRGCDIEWGLNVIKANKLHVLDWSIKCKHWNLIDDQSVWH